MEFENLPVNINIALNYDELCLIENALSYYFKMSAVPHELLAGYPHADLKSILGQIETGKILAEM